VTSPTMSEIFGPAIRSLRRRAIRIVAGDGRSIGRTAVYSVGALAVLDVSTVPVETVLILLWLVVLWSHFVVSEWDSVDATHPAEEA
jgi:hypothetical protein